MKPLYWGLNSVFEIIGLLVVLCCHFNYTEAISPSQKTFICTANNIFDQPTTSYINCTFKLTYTGEFKTKCLIMTVEKIMGIGIAEDLLEPELNNGTQEQKDEMNFSTLRCVSNVAVNIRTVVAQSMDLADFTDISRSRMFNPFFNETQYILNVRLSQIKHYLVLMLGGLRYRIFSTPIPMNKIDIFIGGNILDNQSCFPTMIAFCGSTVCRHDVSLTNLLVNEFIEIPVPILEVVPFIVKEICKFEANMSRCNGMVRNLPTVCLAVEDSKIILDKLESSAMINDSIYRHRIPFYEIANALNLTSDKLKIIETADLTDQYMDQLAQCLKNQTDKPFHVPRDQHVEFDDLERFMNYLSWNSKDNCVRPQTLNFDQLQFALQLLGVKEILIGGKDDLSFTKLLGFKIRSKLLLDYGHGNYTIRGLCSIDIPISIDFSPHPYSKYQYFVQHRRYDLFAKELASKRQLSFSCPSTAHNADFLLRSDSNNTTRVFHYKNLSNRHGFQSFSLAHVSFHQTFQRFTLSCTTPKEHVWTLENMYGKPLSYSSEMNHFTCHGINVNLNHWKCRNRIQCEAVAFSCIQNITNEGFLPDGLRLFTDQLRNDGSRLFTNGVAFNSFCMHTLNEFNVERCRDGIRGIFESPESCATTKPSNMGILQCISRSDNFSESHVIYFQGFDGNLYVDDDMGGPPPMEAVLKLTTTSNENIFYTKVKYTFFCEAHSFIYDDGIWWLLKYKNGTTLKPAGDPVNDSIKNKDEVSNSKSQLTLVLLDASLEEVICFAPYVKDLDFSNVSMTIKILPSAPPTITTSTTDIEFPENSTHQSLYCAASGHPTPKISWRRNNEDIQKPVSIIEENTLFFPFYNSSLSGEYICSATNVAGNDTKTFLVQEKKTWKNTLMFAIIGVISSFIIFLSILFLIYLTNEKVKRYREMREVIKLLNGKKGTAGSGNVVDVDAYQTNFLFDTKYDLKKNTFIIDQSILLGKGEFGEVYRGLLRGRNEAVAFKTVSPHSEIQHLKALVSEAKILMYIGPHVNLVTLLGVYRQEIKSGILYLAIEYCEIGSLESFLRNNHNCFKAGKILNTTINYTSHNSSTDRSLPRERTLSKDELRKSLCTVKTLILWSEEIANAMEYLGTKNVIHSDLATRNVLLTSEGSAKVTDFGLSRRTYNYSEYIKTGKDPIPWRWLAIESLRTNTFSTKSDVWAYGILLWEIFSLGAIPYPGMSPTLEFVQELENGLRNCKPKWASDEIYNIMVCCWHLDPEQRPTFSSIRAILNPPISVGLIALSDKVNVRITNLHLEADRGKNKLKILSIPKVL